MNKITKNLKLPLLFIFAIVVRTIQFFLYDSTSPFGYDAGFYRRYLIDDLHFWQSVPGLGPNATFVKIILDILKLFHLPTNVILYGSFIVVGGLTAVALYYLIRKYSNENVALITSVLFAISPIQYFAYWCMLYKNAWGLLFLIVTLYLIERNSWWLYVATICLALSHQTTTVIFILTLCIFWLIRKEHRLRTFLLISICTTIMLLTQIKSVGGLITNPPQASFNSWFQFIVFSAPLIVLSIYGFKHWYKDSKKSILFSFVFVAILYPIFHLPFYQRIFVFTDLAIIIIGAHGLFLLWQKKYAGKVVSILFFIGIICILGNRIYKLQPNIYNSDIVELENIDKLTADGSYVLTPSNLAPWVEGWSHRHVIAPGMLHDRHNMPEWQRFWNAKSDEKIKFLDEFPKPLTLFVPPNQQKLFLPDTCIEQPSLMIFKYECK